MLVRNNAWGLHTSENICESSCIQDYFVLRQGRTRRERWLKMSDALPGRKKARF
jgi:hypothetical protein